MTISSITGDTAAAAAAVSTKTSGSDSGFSDVLRAASDGCDAETSLDSLFETASETYGVPVNLLKAVAKAESNFNTNAVSSCGAQGVMQLMPSTASSLGVTDAFDAGQNIMAGAKMLSGLLTKYDGDTALALAAYNAGSGNVDKYGGIPPFKETQNYVQKVMEYAGGTVTIPSSASMVSSSSLSGASSASGSSSAGSLELLQLLAEQMKTNALSAAYGSGSSSDSDDSLNSLYSLLGGSGYSTAAADGTADSSSSLINLLNLYSGTNLTTASALEAMLASYGTASGDSGDTGTDETI